MIAAGRTSCTVKSKEKLICEFPHDISKTQTDFCVYFYPEYGGEGKNNLLPPCLSSFQFFVVIYHWLLHITSVFVSFPELQVITCFLKNQRFTHLIFSCVMRRQMMSHLFELFTKSAQNLKQWRCRKMENEKPDFITTHILTVCVNLIKTHQALMKRLDIRLQVCGVIHIFFLAFLKLIGPASFNVSVH